MKLVSKIIHVRLLFLGVILLPSCGGDKKENKKRGLVVVNVLDRELYEDCHIKDSICVPFEQVESYAVENIDKDAEVVLYCSNCYCSASGQACKQLKKLGFNNVCAYEGGTAEWYQNRLPVEGPGTKKYLKQKVAQPTHQFNIADVPLITMHQLAQKMGIK